MYLKRYFFEFLFFAVTIVALLISCKAKDRKQATRIERDDIYLDYKIWGDEERNLVTVTLQYREGDATGDPIALRHPAEVTMDGKLLSADSSVMNGVYYEVSTTVGEFEGEHEIKFKDAKGKIYRENFQFAAMRLKSEPPAEVTRQDLLFYLDGLDTSDFVHVVMTDTSFYSRGIDRVDTVRDGKLVITDADLQNLRDGPVFLEFYRETNRPLKETGRGGGRIAISYSLKRSFLLRDRGARR